MSISYEITEMQDTFCVKEYDRVNCVQIVFSTYSFRYNLINGEGGRAVKFAIRLTTGFFETSPYELRVCKGKLILFPENDPGNITSIEDGEVTGITLAGGKTVRFEITAGELSCQGFLQERSDLESLLSALKSNLSTTILCQYEGGREHA